ncbi:MAG: peptidase S8, partial [Chloroflexi bacterium]
MLADTDRGVPAGLSTRIVVEPPRAVALSVLPAEEPARAEAVSVGSGIPEELLRRYGARVRQTHRRANVVVLEVPADRQEPLLRELAAAGLVARAPKPVYPLLNESVPSLAIPPVWRSGFLGSGTRIAIVDTGADRHPDFGDRIAAAHDFTGGRGLDDVGHGTHVAGIVAGAGSVYRGVAPKAMLIVAKALSMGGGTEDTVLAALSWASRQKVDVINLSLGGPGDPTDPLSREVDALSAEGILVCVAAGNSGPGVGTIGSPGCAAGAITVGATDKMRHIAEYSSRGPVPGLSVHKPDVV